jgi:DNA polymerase-1
MTSVTRPRVFLVDGYALIYRAFFAMINRPLRTGRGENTSAVWGVANFLERLFREHRPSHVAWVHDSGSSFREEYYPEYKATREKLDAELQADFDRSLERVTALLDAWRVSLVTVDGYEADDVIGTMATQATAAGFDSVIISGDKDFYQLIDEHVSLLNPGRGGPAAVSEQFVDRSNADERLGVPPHRVVDYLALVGDASDNVPGVKGVGDKTARKLIEAYGDLESILAHAGEVKGKRAREALLAEQEEARLSRTLVTIRCDVPLTVDMATLATTAPDTTRLAALYGELEFHSLLGRLGQAPATPPAASDGPPAAATPAPAPERAARVVGTADVAGAVEELRAQTGPIATDVVLSGPDPLRSGMVGVALAGAHGSVWYAPVGHHTPGGDLLAAPPPNLPPLADPAMADLRALLEDPAVPKLCHDAKRLVLACRAAGVELAGVAGDLMLASFVVEPGRRGHTLDALTVEYLATPVPARPDIKRPGRGEVPSAEWEVDEMARVMAARLGAAFEVDRQLRTQLEARSGVELLAEIELPLVDVLAAMEWRGIAIDETRLGGLSQELSTQLAELEATILDEAGTEFNVNSTPQLRHVLFEKLGLPVVKRTKTGPSTDAEVLQELAALGHRLPALLLEYRELAKLRSTYVDALPLYVHERTGRVHTSFSQTGAATGRLSSSDPNLQNIPIRTARGGEIRRCFVPAPGMRFVVADYSQIELRLLAHLSEDPVFIEAFGRGGDIHRETAATIFDVDLADVTSEMRARAKTINFATIYGQGAFSLARQLAIPIEEAKAFIALYFERFAGVRTFLDRCVAEGRERGYVATMDGRRRYVPELQDRTHNVRAFGERVAMNSPLQGSAADLIKRAMIALASAIATSGREVHLLLQVHDELILEAAEADVAWAEATVRREMEGAAALRVPLLVDVGSGRDWLDAKP